MSTVDQFDKCSIGCGPDGEEPFCGQMAALYVVAEAITLQQANSLFCLGAAYQSNFRHDAESDLPDGYKKVGLFFRTMEFCVLSCGSFRDIFFPHFPEFVNNIAFFSICLMDV